MAKRKSNYFSGKINTKDNEIKIICEKVKELSQEVI